jgi:hypothetical protein
MAIPWGYYTPERQGAWANRSWRLSGCSLDAVAGAHRGGELLADKPPDLFRPREAVLQPPCEDRPQDGGQREPLGRQPVLGAKGVLAVDRTLDEAALLEPLEAAGEELGRDARQGGEELAEPALAEEEVADDEQCPAVPDDVEGLGDGASLVVRLGILEDCSAGVDSHE